MATSKIRPIKKTLKRAIDYVINPEKTEDGKLVYTFGCSVGTADIEMKLTAKQGSERGNRIAYHLIQSFPKDEVTPEQAFELGKEFAGKVTNGRYEFVLGTHVNTKHIHNHIIINAVNFVDYKKYHYDVKEKYHIRDINDKICKENGLSVIEKFSGNRSKGKYEYEQSKAGTSWKDKLTIAIDQTIGKANTFKEFIEMMELEGYEIKQGKHIAFRASGQEHFTRAKRLGENYTEEAIRERIYFNEVTIRKKKAFSQKRVNLLVDISKNIKAQQSKGYEQALVRSNINTLNKTMNYLMKHKITTLETFTALVEGKRAEYFLNQKNMKEIESKLLDLSQKIKFTQNHRKYKSVYIDSQHASQKQEFYYEHEDEIVLYKASEVYFERNRINPEEIKLKDLFEEYKELKQEKSKLWESCNALKKSINEMEIIEKNIETALGINMTENKNNQSSIESKRHTDKEK